MQILFPREQQLTFDNGGVDFPAIVDGRRVPCKISGKALDNHFKAETEGMLRSFLKHRSEIEAKARELIEQQKFQRDGSLLIDTFEGLSWFRVERFSWAHKCKGLGHLDNAPGVKRGNDGLF